MNSMMDYQEVEEAVREAQRHCAPETVVFIPPQPFRQPEATPPRVQWQPERRPEYNWGEPDGE